MTAPKPKKPDPVAEPDREAALDDDRWQRLERLIQSYFPSPEKADVEKQCKAEGS